MTLLPAFSYVVYQNIMNWLKHRFSTNFIKSLKDFQEDGAGIQLETRGPEGPEALT